jgi:hypothetical protein
MGGKKNFFEQKKNISKTISKTIGHGGTQLRKTEAEGPRSQGSPGPT